MTRKEEIRQQCEQKSIEMRQVCGIGDAWYAQSRKVLTDAEKAEVKALWDTMSGSSCWNDAFLRWMKQ